MLIPHAPFYARRFLLLVQFLVAYKTTMPAKLIEFHDPRKPLAPPQVTPVDLGSVRVSIGRQRFTILLSATIVSGEPPPYPAPEAEAPPRKMPEPPEGSESLRNPKS